MISISCNNCQKTCKVDEKYLGKKGKCPKCKTEILVEYPQERQETLPKNEQFSVHDQDFGPLKKEKKGLFSSEKISQVCIALMIFGGIGYYGYIYILSVSAQKFVDSYNPIILSLQTHVGEIQGNLGEVESYAAEKLSELENTQSRYASGDASIVELQKAISENTNTEKEIQEIFDRNEKIYPLVYNDLEKLENDSCTLLKKSHEECIAFITAYKALIDALKNQDVEAMDNVGAELIRKNNSFKTAALKDGIQL